MSIRIYVNDKGRVLSGLITDVLRNSPYPYMEHDRLILGDDLPDDLKHKLREKKVRVTVVTSRDCLHKDYHLAPGIYRMGASLAEVEKMAARTYQWELRVRGKSLRSVLKLRDLVLAGKIEPTLAFPQEETLPSSAEPSGETKEDSAN